MAMEASERRLRQLDCSHPAIAPYAVGLMTPSVPRRATDSIESAPLTPTPRAAQSLQPSAEDPDVLPTPSLKYATEAENVSVLSDLSARSRSA